MKKIIKYLRGIDGWLYVILFFCLIGLLRNGLQLFRFGFDYSSIATKVFVAMIMIYGVQAMLLLMRERKAWFISAIQAFFCFYVFEDFTFLPFSNLAKMIIFKISPDMNYSWHYFMNTVIISAMFSLELLKTYIIYALTEEPQPAETEQKETAPLACEVK